MTEFRDRLQRALNADFLIDREIGGGGMSRVFLATERALQRRVVIKVLPPDLAAGVNVDRFRREIQLVAQLQHPHIVPVLAAGDDDDLLWYTMPYIEGESLRGTLKRSGRLPVRDVVRILHDVVDALAYAHARGVVHRDIKPDNILTSGMHALVTDFGVAKALSAAIPVVGGTTTGMAIGTPAYMAPEQLAADPAADHRVDLYAVGLLGYELLSGTSPFIGSSPQATLAAQLTFTPPAPHIALTDVSESLSAIIMHCLEKDASKRPESATALMSALDALPTLGTGQLSSSRPKRRRRWPLVAAATVVVAATFATAQMMRDRSSVPSAQAAGTSDLRSANTGASRGGNTGAGGSATRQTDSNAAQTGPAVADGGATNGAMNGAAFRDSELSPNSNDGGRAVTVPIVITRAESLAIAQVVLRRSSPIGGSKLTNDSMKLSVSGSIASGGAPRRIIVQSAENPNANVALDREALMTEVKRIFNDSIAQVFSRIETEMAKLPRNARMDSPQRPPEGIIPLIAPPTDGRTRVVVSNYSNATGKRELGVAGRDAATFLRSAMPADKYDVIDNETTDRASRGGADRLSIGWGLRADYVISGFVQQRGDSLVFMTMFTDVRGGRFTRVVETTAPTSDFKKAFDPAMAKVSMWLDSAKVLASRGGSRSRPPSERNDGQ